VVFGEVAGSHLFREHLGERPAHHNGRAIDPFGVVAVGPAHYAVRRYDLQPLEEGAAREPLCERTLQTLSRAIEYRDRGWTFLNVFPSAKAQIRAREKLRELTGHHRCFAPIPEVFDEVNRWLMGWGNYFRYGHPGRVFASMNWYVQNRLRRHLKRRSQRHLRIPEGESFYALLQRLGVRRLRATRG
jgi:hypothetical protein